MRSLALRTAALAVSVAMPAAGVSAPTFVNKIRGRIAVFDTKTYRLQ